MTNKEYAQCLRQIAAVYEQNPDIKQPYEGADSPWWIFTWNAEDFARTVAAFGRGNKRFGDNELLFIPDTGLQLQIRCQRDQICERRVVGKRLVPERIEPAKPAVVIAAHECEQYMKRFVEEPNPTNAAIERTKAVALMQIALELDRIASVWEKAHK